MWVLSSLKGSPLGASHAASRALTCSACARRVTQGQQVVGVPDQDRGARSRRPGVAAGGDVADSGGLFHPVQGHVHQHGADHPALRAAPLGRGEPALIDHARLQPVPRPFPWRGKCRAGRGDEHDRCGRTRRPSRRRAPTRACRSYRVRSRRWPASRPGSSGPAGTHTIWTQTGPPTRVPARPTSGPAAPCRRSRECRARAVSRLPSG